MSGLPLGSRIRRLFGAVKTPIPAEPIVYKPIGIVRNRVDQPRTSGWGDVESDIFIREDLAPALGEIEGYSHLIVVFHFDRVSQGESQRARVNIGADGVEVGVLASRSPLWPNPIGVSVARLVRRRGNVLRVRGLDALDRTPVLDIKPYLPPYDAVPDAELPDWAWGEDSRGAGGRPG